jgi:hypothetical protein
VLVLRALVAAKHVSIARQRAVPRATKIFSEVDIDRGSGKFNPLCYIHGD